MPEQREGEALQMSDLREIVKAATPGPRVIREDEGSSLFDVLYPHDLEGERLTYLCMSVLEGDAHFIATFNPERVKAMLDVIEAAREVRTGLGLTAYEGTPVSVWSAKHYEKQLGNALAALDSSAPLREGSET